MIRDVAACLALVVLAGLIYGVTGDFGFLHFDDPDYLTSNPAVRQGLTWQGVCWAFSLDGPNTYWHPLTWLSLMLDVELFGLSARAVHLVNAALHTAGGILFFIFLRRATGRHAASLMAAALFAAHPLAVEAVAWAAERKTVLSGVFAMAAVCSYAWYARRPGWKRMSLTALWMALGLMSKPTLVALPLGLMALDYWPLGRWGRFASGEGRAWPLARSAMEKWPLWAMSAGATVLVVLSRSDVTMGGDSMSGPGLMLRLENMPVAFVRYLGKFAWASNLSIYYPFPTDIPWWQWSGAVALLLFSVFLAWRFRERVPFLLAGMVWFLAMLLPVSGFVQSGLWPAMADRFVYLPLAGLAAAFAFGYFRLMSGYRGPAMVLAVVLVLGHFALDARARVGDWSSGVTLFAKAADLAPEDAVCRHHLGVALLNEGRMEEALSCFGRASGLSPKYARPRIMAGQALLRLMEYEEAEREFRAALDLDGGSRDAGLGLGRALAGQGRQLLAAAAFEEVLKKRPDDLWALAGLARAQLETGRPDKAWSLLERHRQGGLDTADLLALAGRAALGVGRTDDALELFSLSLELQPSLAEALAGKARALAALGRTGEAAEFRKMSDAAAMIDATAFANLGRAALAAGRARDARGFYRQALSLNRDYPEAAHGLARAESAM